MANIINLRSEVAKRHPQCMSVPGRSKRPADPWRRMSRELRAGMAWVGQCPPWWCVHGRIVRKAGSVNSPRQREVMSQVKGEPKDPFRKGRRHGWRQGYLQHRCKVYPGNPHIRTAGGRFRLRDTCNLTQGRSECPGMSLNKTPVPTSRVGGY